MKFISTAAVLAAALSIAAIDSPAFADRSWQNHNGNGQNEGQSQSHNNSGNNNAYHNDHHNDGVKNNQGAWKNLGPQGGQGTWHDHRSIRGDNDRWRNNNQNNWAKGNDQNRRLSDDRWRNNNRNDNQNWNDSRSRDRDRRDHNTWDNDRRDHHRHGDHHPRWWRPDFFYYGNYWYPHYYNDGWNDSWRYGIGLRFFDDLYWWNYEDEWWFWDTSGACWRQGDPRWDGSRWRDGYWPREWNDYRWRFCYDGGDDAYDGGDDY